MGGLAQPPTLHKCALGEACLANNKHYDLHKLPTLDKIIGLLGAAAMCLLLLMATRLRAAMQGLGSAMPFLHLGLSQNRGAVKQT